VPNSSPQHYHLTILSLSKNHIGSVGTQALAVAVRPNSTLTTLDLSYAKIGSNGARALAEALLINHTITSLNLDSNLLGEGDHTSQIVTTTANYYSQ
jgi:hypothetical protein